MLIKALILIISFYPSVQFFFTSVLRTKELVNVETQMLVELGKYVDEADLNGGQIIDEVKEFYFHAKRENLKAIITPSFIENPLNSFHFFKRMYKQWTKVETMISCDSCAENPVLSDLIFRLMKVEEQYKVTPAELEDDFNGALIGLIRLWRTYKLNVTQIILGKIRDEQSEPLEPEDVYSVCSNIEDNLSEEKQWLEALLEIQKQNSTDSPGISKTVRALASVLWKIGLESQALSLLKEQLIEDPTNKKLKADFVFYEAKFADKTSSDQVLQTDEGDSFIEHLCRGEGIRDLRTIAKLGCINRKTSIPVYFAKEEILSIDPRVSILYEVVNPSEIEDIKHFAANKLADSEVMNLDGSGSVATHVRVSQTTWIADMEHPTVAKVSARVELITGLSTKLGVPNEYDHAEPLQVLNYGFGGMYVPHLDQVNHTILPDSADKRGERMATWMFYLNDVKAGGATVFPKLNITVPVTKGAAAFWYNTKRSGDSDERLTHAGCPVLIGSKWGNKSSSFINQKTSTSICDVFTIFDLIEK